MAGQSVTHLALDGGLAEIRNDAAVQLDLSDPYTSVAHALVGTQRLDFTSGILSFAEAAATQGAGIPLTEEFNVQGGRLRTGSRLDAEGLPSRAAAWEGAAHSIYTILYGDEAVNHSDVLRAFLQIGLEETEKGIVIRPERSDSLSFVRPPKIIKFVPQLGLLDIAPITQEIASEIPNWPGAPVPGGEIFSDTAGEFRYFVLVSESARTLVLPGAGVAEGVVLTILSGLHVHWEQT